MENSRRNIVQAWTALMAVVAATLTLMSCYQQDTTTPDAWLYSEEQLDSISFSTSHHYTQNYQFCVVADSLLLVAQQPGEVLSGLEADTLAVRHGDRLVVAEIQMMPSDDADSVWVRLARDENLMGWTHESELLSAAAPDHWESRLILFFSQRHLLIGVVGVGVMVLALAVRLLIRRRPRPVPLFDIPSFYPTLLCLLVAYAAVLYSTIQHQTPEAWRHFYYHPTLNPFLLPPLLGLLITLVWAIIIVTMAVADDVRRLLPIGQTVVYLLGVAGMCCACYVVFTLSSLWSLGWPLLVVGTVWAFRRYWRKGHTRYVCGRCGYPLRQVGTCPHCGATNENPHK